VQEPFFEHLRIAEKGELTTLDASRKVEPANADVVRKRAGIMRAHKPDCYFDMMLVQYLLNISAHEVVRDITRHEWLPFHLTLFVLPYA